MLTFAPGRVLLACALALTWLFALAACAEATQFGVHQDLHYDGYDWRRAKAISAAGLVHAQTSRSTLLWSKIEAVEGRYDWTRADQIVSEVRAAGMTPLLVVAGSPAWANGSSDPWAVPADPAAFAAWKDAYADFIGQAVRRYRSRVGLWEIWNEPNERYTWKPAPTDAGRYGELFAAARAAARAADPAARVAVGGLAGLNASCCIAGKTFLKQLIDRGVRFDDVAIHPYSGTRGPDAPHQQWENNFDDIRMIHDLLDNSSRRGVKLWITEWGWSSAHLGPDTQAAYLSRSLERIRDEWSSFVDVATYFVDYDRGTTYNQGLVDADFQPKPAAYAFQRFMKESESVAAASQQPISSGTAATLLATRDAPVAVTSIGVDPGAATVPGGAATSRRAPRAASPRCLAGTRRSSVLIKARRRVSCSTARAVWRRLRIADRSVRGWRCRGRSSGACLGGAGRGFSWRHIRVVAPSEKGTKSRNR